MGTYLPPRVLDGDGSSSVTRQDVKDVATRTCSQFGGLAGPNEGFGCIRRAPLPKCRTLRWSSWQDQSDGLDAVKLDNNNNEGREQGDSEAQRFEVVSGLRV